MSSGSTESLGSGSAESLGRFAEGEVPSVGDGRGIFGEDLGCCRSWAGVGGDGEAAEATLMLSDVDLWGVCFTMPRTQLGAFGVMERRVMGLERDGLLGCVLRLS